MAPTTTTALVPRPGARIVVERLPGMAPAFVYLHGLGSTRHGEKSEAVFAHAARRGHAACRFDFSGHGESAGRLERVTLTELIDDVRAVVAASGPAVLVGSSLGGLVASWLAATEPRDVAALVLLAPAFGFLPRLLAHGAGTATVLVTPDRELCLEPAVLTDASRYDEDTLPAAVNVPTMVVHGALDDTVPAEVSRRFHDGVAHPAKRLRILLDGDHRLHGPIASILDEVHEFLADHGVVARGG